MRGLLWKSVGLCLLVMFLAGCAEDQSAVQSLQSENQALRGRVADLDANNMRLTAERTQVEKERDLERTNAAEWQARYAAAQDNAVRRGMGVPPDVLAKFMEIARAGKSWEYKEGVLRTKTSDLLFDSGKADLKAEAQAAIQEVAPKLKEILADKTLFVRVDGHTDSDPIRTSGWKDNLHLSMMRALAVAEALKKEGIPATSILTAGFGETRPIPGAAKAQNRRVELVLLSASQTSAP